jgi:hypothetical protein
MEATTIESRQLNTKADWPQWYSSVICRARRDGILDYCNPELAEEDSAIASSSTAPPAAATSPIHRVLIEPIRPTASQINPDATLLSELNDEELDRWVILRNGYNDRMREYEKKHKAILELAYYIESTVDRSNYIIIRDLITPYEMLKALKQMLEPTSMQLKWSARATYESAQKWNSRTKPEIWIRTYRDAYLEAKSVQLPIVDDYNPHYDFVRAIAQAHPECSSAILSILIQREQKGEEPPDFITSCLEFFQRWQRLRPATQPGANHTGFATFQGQPAQPIQPNTQPGHQPQGQIRGRGRGQGQGQWNPPRSTCRFCTGRHPSERCYYVDPRQRTINWQEVPHYREQFDQILANNPALKQEAESIRSRPVPTSQPL